MEFEWLMSFKGENDFSWRISPLSRTSEFSESLAKAVATIRSSNTAKIVDWSLMITPARRKNVRGNWNDFTVDALAEPPPSGAPEKIEGVCSHFSHRSVSLHFRGRMFRLTSRFAGLFGPPPILPTHFDDGGAADLPIFTLGGTAIWLKCWVYIYIILVNRLIIN